MPRKAALKPYIDRTRTRPGASTANSSRPALIRTNGTQMEEKVDDYNTLIAALAAGIAIGLPLSAVATLRLGLGGRIRTITYYKKRLSLIGVILRDHRGSLSSGQLTALEAEIQVMSADLIASSPRFEAERFLARLRQLGVVSD